MAHPSGLTLAKKKVEQPPESPEAKTTMKVRQSLLRKAKMVATFKGIDLFDYIDQLLSPMVDDAYSRMMREERDEP